MKMSKVLSAALLAATMLSGSVAMAAEQIKIIGSTTVLPIMQKTMEAYMAANPAVEITLSGGGSGTGIKSIIDGLATIGMASRDIKESEIALAQKNGFTPKRTTVAIDAIIPVINPKNPVDNLTVEQLRNIYNGNIKNWKEVGGNDAPIVVISRDNSSGTYETWLQLIMNKERVVPTASAQASTGSVVQMVGTNPNAIGYIGFGYLNDTLKALHVDGVEVSEKTALNGTWAITRDLYVFTNGKEDATTKAFLDFVLDPKKGQKLVEEVGYIRFVK